MGDYGSSQNLAGGYGGSQQPGTYANNAKPKQQPPKPPAPRPIVSDIRLHMYLPIPRGHQAFINYMNHSWDNTGLGPFDPFGVTMTLFENEKKGLEDFKTSMKAKANIVILAGCATDACVPAKLKNSVIVITTASGRDSVTHSSFWARALTGFLLALVGWKFDGNTVTQLPSGTATVQEAIDIGNEFFPKGDSFVLASVNGNVREF
jgi:hypothetical protein